MADGEAFFGEGPVPDNAVEQRCLIQSGEQDGSAAFAASHCDGGIVVVDVVHFSAVLRDIFPAEFVGPGNQRRIVALRSKPGDGTSNT